MQKVKLAAGRIAGFQCDEWKAKSFLRWSAPLTKIMDDDTSLSGVAKAMTKLEDLSKAWGDLDGAW